MPNDNGETTTLIRDDQRDDNEYDEYDRIRFVFNRHWFAVEGEVTFRTGPASDYQAIKGWRSVFSGCNHNEAIALRDSLNAWLALISGGKPDATL